MLAVAFVALVVSALATLVIPMAVRRMIDFGFGQSDGAFIGNYFVMLIVVGSVLAIAAATRFYAVNWLGERVVADLRKDVFEHMARLSPAFYEQTHSAEVMSRLTADTTQLKAAAGSVMSQALRNAILLVGALIMMLITSVKLSLMVLLAIPAIMIPLMLYGRSIRALSRRAQDSLAEASSYAAENLAAVRTMQAFGTEGAVVTRFDGAAEGAFEAARARMRARSVLTGAAMFLMVTSVVGVLWYGATAVVAGEMTGGRLGQFVLYAVFAATAVASLAEVWGEIQQAAGAAERLAELLAVEPQIVTPALPLALPSPAAGRIAFEGVRFSYPTRPQERALDDVSFEVEAGETVAIVGPSGAGKSTLFSLLLRFYDYDAGSVRLDSVPVERAALADLRARFALVPQEVALFADTVAANIAYGTPMASREAIERAAQVAMVTPFVNELPDGFDTLLGERGVSLSGGQRQRLAIARAVLRDAPVLLLDEATSALDAQNERLVQEALDALMANRTTLVIAHRLATVQSADRIIVMDEGRIVDSGTHAELVRHGGLYSRLADMQFTADAAE